MDYQAQEKIGEVVMNPYDIAPLTAVIRNGGYQLRDGHVRVVTQKKRQGNADKINNKKLFKYGGVSLFCFFPGFFKNLLSLYKKKQGRKKQKIKKKKK
ncbi:aryl-sulfate sulfotransferase N-terminal domain-containing protein, partial [Salmonella enterica]|uniref:aryl-sulfate sulfotransferase N-terminal domain-containing protein n=1 Tax=Salmonella enterica TaxID=28901 RepID=UPI001CB7ED50